MQWINENCVTYAEPAENIQSWIGERLMKPGTALGNY